MRSMPLVLRVVVVVLAWASVIGAAGDAEDGSVRIIAPLGASILMDGRPVGSVRDTTGLLVEGVPAGTHTFKAVKEDCDVQASSLWLKPGSEVTVRFGPFSRLDPNRESGEVVPPAAPAETGAILVHSPQGGASTLLRPNEREGMSHPDDPWLAAGVSTGEHVALVSGLGETVRVGISVGKDTLHMITVDLERGSSSQIPVHMRLLPEWLESRLMTESGNDPSCPPPASSTARVVRRTEPVYPEMARLSELEAVVMVKVGVDRRGRATHTQVVQGVHGLNEAAEDCVSHWEFEPASYLGVAIPTTLVVPIRFQLPD